MHLKLLGLFLFLSLCGLAGFYIKNNETGGTNVQGARIASKNKQAASTSYPPTYVCTIRDYVDANCTQEVSPPQTYVYTSGSPYTGSCKKYGQSDVYKNVECVVATPDTCIMPNQCQAGGYACCDGSQPEYYPFCAPGSATPRYRCKANASSNGCGAPCGTVGQVDQCATGLSCQNIGGSPICYNSSICISAPENRTRVRGVVRDCNNNPAGNVKVTMFSNTSRDVINTTYTNAAGVYQITKKYKGGVPAFALMAGTDAGATGTGYYGRVETPAFMSPTGTSYNCAVVNCNYRGAQISGGPYRENYHLGNNWTQAQYKERVVHGTNFATGFDFKQHACPVPKQVTVRALGNANQNAYPLVTITANGQEVQRFNVTGTFADYVVTVPASTYEVKVNFLNDDGPKDLRVDYIKVDTTTYQAEAATVYSEGSWSVNNNCGGGYKMSEWLHCNGFFKFNIASN